MSRKRQTMEQSWLNLNFPFSPRPLAVATLATGESGVASSLKEWSGGVEGAEGLFIVVVLTLHLESREATVATRPCSCSRFSTCFFTDGMPISQLARCLRANYHRVEVLRLENH